MAEDIERYYEYNEQFTEYIEGCCADLALQKTGMLVKMTPYGDKGPDLHISTRRLSFDVDALEGISLGNKIALDEKNDGLLKEMPDKSQNVWSKIDYE